MSASDTIERIRQYRYELRQLIDNPQTTRQQVRAFKAQFLEEQRFNAQKAIDIKLAEQKQRRLDYQKHIAQLDSQYDMVSLRPKPIDAEKNIPELNAHRIAYKNIKQISNIDQLLNKLQQLISDVQDFLFQKE